MIETYREENELVQAEQELRNKAILENEERMFGEEEDDMESLMDDDSWEDSLPDLSNEI